MAERPVFVPCPIGTRLVKEMSFEFGWSGGFAVVQKKKNITALHIAAAEKGYEPLLEVSTKSDEKLGQRLSAFNLNVRSKLHGDIPLECAYQGSKVFEHGGPYTDLFLVDPREAKTDPRIRSSGGIVAFHFNGLDFPTEPKTAFYDWLYISAIFPHRVFLRRLEDYLGFTDIEFNPSKSVNCQARSCATFVAMARRGVLEGALQSPESFVATLRPDSSTELHTGTPEELVPTKPPLTFWPSEDATGIEDAELAPLPNPFLDDVQGVLFEGAGLKKTKDGGRSVRRKRTTHSSTTKGSSSRKNKGG